MSKVSRPLMKTLGLILIILLVGCTVLLAHYWDTYAFHKKLSVSFVATTKENSPPAAPRIKSKIVLGWTRRRKSMMTSNWDKDGWLQLRLAKTKSFKHCHERGLLPRHMQCKYTDDKNKYKQSDAVLFRGILLAGDHLPAERLSEQSWIFVEHEPPYKMWARTNLSHYNGIFNITATFTHDSDIPRNDFRQNCWRNTTRLKELSNINYAEKKKTNILVAWLVSDCDTQSQREKYVEELSKHIRVDIYGKCGDKKCGSRYSWSTDNCFRHMLHDKGSYKFYLSFENSLCEDYVTEKFWSMLDLDVIPIVMGAVDYTGFWPKDSFIDVRDFKNPQDLAEFLFYLHNNPKQYNQYIRNKNSLVCQNQELEVPWECSLCRYLHEHRDQRKVVTNLDTFWGPPRCSQPTVFSRSKSDN